MVTINLRNQMRSWNVLVHGSCTINTCKYDMKWNDMTWYNTSSTAQGSGGSFKDRKPIGEFGCCESWMAERTHWWIERWLECRAIYLSMYLSVYLSVDLSNYLSINLSIDRSIYLPICLSICLSPSLENGAILRDFLETWKLKAEKRCFSASFPSNLEVDNIKNTAILQDFLQIWKLSTSRN